MKTEHVVGADASGTIGVAAEVLGHRAERDVPLAPLTTYRVGGRAALFVRAGSVDDLVSVAQARAASHLPVLVVGRGSNLLVADTGFAGIVVSTAGFAERIEVAGRVVVAGAGVSLPVLARRTAAVALTGFEWAVGVPGSVGGAVRMNAGGHGSDMATTLVDVDVVDLAGGSAAVVTTLPAGGLGLRFRGSSLRDDQVIVNARIRLEPGDRERSEREIADIVRWRRANQPGGQNCGSVFVNPVPGEVTAGALIDGLGLRGLRIGGAWVSEKHANFIQATPDACARDVYDLITLVRERVADATGYVMRSEVRLVGFDTGADA